MARTPRGTVEAEPVNENTEAPEAVETVEVAAPEATETPAPAEGEAPAKAEEVVDLTEFQARVAEGVAGADTTTGDVAEAFKAAVTKAYRELGPKGKKAAKKAMQDQLKSAINEIAMVQARALMLMNDAMVEGQASGGGTKAVKEPVDPTDAFVARAVALRLAANVFAMDVPEGVKPEWTELAKTKLGEVTGQVATYKEYLAAVAAHEGDDESAPKLPEGIDPIVVSAFKVASGRGGALPKAPRASGGASRPAFDGPRRDIKKHILEAFENVKTGDFLTVAEIRSFKSSEYGDEQPSSGAISARLFPNSGKVTVPGITPGEHDGKKGAFKA